MPRRKRGYNEELKNINKNYVHIGVDPGKRNIVHMIDNNGKKLKYTSLQRRHECLHKKNKKIIDKLKTKIILDKERELSKINSKSSYVKSFCEYIAAKNKVNNELFDFYNKKIFRRLKWKSYIETQKSEMNFVNKIKNTYEKNGKKI